MEKFNLAQLTKEMVVTQIRNMTDPITLAAEIVRGTLIARLKDRNASDHDVQEAVIEICRGAMIGMLLTDCSLARGAAALLESVERAAGTAGVDPELTVVAALRGLADSKRFVQPETIEAIRTKLRDVKPEAVRIFDRFCSDLHASQSHPEYLPPRL